MPVATAGRRLHTLPTKMAPLFVGIAAVLITALVLATSAGADVDMTGRLIRVKKPNTQLRTGATPFATTANGTYRCAYEYSVIANWYYYFALGNCRAGWELEVVSYASENSVTHEHSYGGFVNGAFSGCGWIDTRFPLEKLNNNAHSTCAGGGSSREFKVEESSFMEKYNGGTVGDGNPVVNTKPCPEYANYRPWSASNVEKELIRTAPAYAASGPGSNYPAIKWRYVTKYASTDGSGKYVMVRDDRIAGAGEGNWVFVPLSCLKSSPSELPENSEERNPPPPTATTGGSSSITATSATLAGAINPNGLDTHYYIEWGKEASKPYEAFAPTPYPGEDLGSGTTTLNRNVSATGLSPNTVYYYRTVASSPTGTSEGSTQSFKTLPFPPEVTTQGASQISQKEATLNGTLNPRGSDTHYYFQYGTTTEYGSSSASVDAGAGTSSVEVHAAVAGLTPGAVYHYRLVASNASGTSYGLDRELTTATYGSPAAVRDSGVNGTWVYEVGSDNAIWEWSASGSTWSHGRLGGEVAQNTSPAVVRESGPGRQWVYYVGTDSTLWEWSWSGSAWSINHLTSAGAASVAPGTSPAAVRESSSGRQWVYYVGTDGTLWEWSWSGSAWSINHLTNSGAAAVAPGTSPAVVRSSSGQQWVYYVGTDGHLWEWSWSGSAWSINQLSGGGAASVAPGTSPAVTRNSEAGQQWVDYIGSDSALWEWSWSGSAWSIARIGGQVAPRTSPSTAHDISGQQWDFYRGNDGSMYYWLWSYPTWTNTDLGPN
jgi:hypothetical protein